eukprot:8193944-Pyramimonas_sp.AAC.1
MAPPSTQMTSAPEAVGLASGWDDANHDPFDDLDHMLDAEAAESIHAVPTGTEGAEEPQPAGPQVPGRPADPLPPVGFRRRMGGVSGAWPKLPRTLRWGPQARKLLNATSFAMVCFVEMHVLQSRFADGVDQTFDAD